MQIDFYLLPDSDETSRLLYACRLTAKAWRAGHRLYLNCRDAQQCEAMDELLWSFSATHFVPHQRAQVGLDAPIVLAHGEDAGGQQDFLLNLNAQVPPFFARFSRVAEVVNQQADVKAALRESYRFYCQHGYQPRHLSV